MKHLYSRLQYGRKDEWKAQFIKQHVWERSGEREKNILKMCNDKLKHLGKKELICNIYLNKSKKTRRGSFYFEEWSIITANHSEEENKYILTNFGRATSEYVLKSSLMP